MAKLFFFLEVAIFFVLLWCFTRINTPMEKKKILFVSQEIAPFLPKSDIAATVRKLPQSVQESGKEIRIFAPRFGVINERRHQLHEVIRLSGINIVIDDRDHPLVIKVASIAPARMQVYFIDNDEYFKRKNNIIDEQGVEFADNDERSLFFCRGVLETIKKLGWRPDVIHCHGWMTLPMGLYVKKVYQRDPHFSDTKVVYSMYNDRFNENWDERFPQKLKFEGVDKATVSKFTSTDFYSIAENMLYYMDGVNIASKDLDKPMLALYDQLTCAKQCFVSEEHQHKIVADFFDKILEETIS